METTVGIVTALNPILGYESDANSRPKPTEPTKELSRSFATRSF